MTTPTSHAIRAAGWLLPGQAFGFAWALLLVRAWGVDSYGQFATGVAAAAMVTIPLDAYYLVRAPRVDEDAFRADRSTRAWLGLALLLAGYAVLPFAPIAGLALAKAGATVVFNAVRSRAIRDGVPELAQRSDTLRALLCLAAGSSVLLAVDGTPFGVLVAAWLVGYWPFLVMAWPLLRQSRPRLPERSSRTAAIVLDAVGGAAYLQGDVVLVALVLGSAEAGRYGFGALIVAAVGAVGLNLGASYHERLRAAHGHWSAGPPVRHVLAGAVLAAAGLAVLALVAGRIAPRADLEGVLFAFATVAATRFISAPLTTVLVVAGLDRQRLFVTATAILVKGGGVLVAMDAAAAVWAYLAGDLVLVAGAVLVLRRTPRHGVVP